jgi:hypothetical protein
LRFSRQLSLLPPVPSGAVSPCALAQYSVSQSLVSPRRSTPDSSQCGGGCNPAYTTHAHFPCPTHTDLSLWACPTTTPSPCPSHPYGYASYLQLNPR